MDNIKLMIVDDQHLVRMGLAQLLRDMRGLEVVAEAESGERALMQLAELIHLSRTPDIILMDMKMPGIGGMETTRKIVHRFPKIKVIAVTGCSETPFPQRFMESGAAGFLTKDSAIDEVVAAIHSVFRGKRYISQRIAQKMAINAATGKTETSPFSLLSERELQIALMVMDGITTADIGESLHLSPKTVNTYRYRLFEKLNIKSNMELAMLATRHGLLETNDS